LWISCKGGIMIETAVIGVGGFGKNHARVLNELEALSVVCDIDGSRARAYGRKYHVPYVTAVEDLRKFDIEAATIVTPTFTHYEVALKLLEMGVRYILVEKPFTATLKEAYELIRKAEEYRAKLIVGFIERFNQAIEVVEKIINDGEIGKPILYYFTRVSRWPERIQDVGVLRDTAIHDIDLSNYLIDEYPEEVYATMGKLQHHKHEDFVNILMKYPEDRTVIIEANWLTPKKTRKMRVTCTDGVVEANLLTQEITIIKRDELSSPNLDWQEPLLKELLYFLNCAERGIEPKPGGREAVMALEIAELVVKSSREGKTVVINK